MGELRSWLFIMAAFWGEVGCWGADCGCGAPVGSVIKFHLFLYKAKFKFRFQIQGKSCQISNSAVIFESC